MNKTASLTLVTQGVKGGNKKEHGQQGLVTVFVGIDKRISFDAYQGFGSDYQKREETLITIRDRGEVFQGTFKELVAKLLEQPETYLWAYGTDEGDFEIELTKQDILDCSHMGNCDKDCERVAQKEYIQKQLQDVSNEAMLSAMAQMGMEVNDENDRKEIIENIIWDAACKLREDITGNLNS